MTRSTSQSRGAEKPISGLSTARQSWPVISQAMLIASVSCASFCSRSPCRPCRYCRTAQPLCVIPPARHPSSICDWRVLCAANLRMGCCLWHGCQAVNMKMGLACEGSGSCDMLCLDVHGVYVRIALDLCCVVCRSWTGHWAVLRSHTGRGRSTGCSCRHQQSCSRRCCRGVEEEGHPCHCHSGVLL